MKRKRIACLLLAALLVCGLAACSMPSVSAGQPAAADEAPAAAQAPAAPAEQPEAAAEQPETPLEQAQTPAEQPQIAAGQTQTTAETEQSAPQGSLTPPELIGRWKEDQGRAELWIQELQGEDILFSLFIPGSAAINNAVAEAADKGFFSYQDPYLEGVGASGSLWVENGVPVLYFGESRLEFPAGTELRFSQRSDEPDYRTLYGPVIEAWQDFELQGVHLENWYGDEPGYVHMGLYGPDHFGYQFWDLDRDGSPELIIGAIYAPEDTADDELGYGLYQHNLIVDLFTLVDGEPTYVVNSGDRYRYSMTSDGQIYYEGSSGAAYTDVATYILRDGALEMVNGISSEEGAWYNMEDGFNPNHEGYNPISEEEFQWLFDHFYDLYHFDRFAALQLRPFLVSEA